MLFLYFTFARAILHLCFFMNMSAIAYPPTKSINTNEAMAAEIAYWKNKYAALLAQISAKQTQQPLSIFIKQQGLSRQITISDIIMMEADSNYTRIHLHSGGYILTSKTLKSWIEKIGTCSDFVRPHRSFLVNRSHILSYQSNPRKIILTGNKEVPLARSFKTKHDDYK